MKITLNYFEFSGKDATYNNWGDKPFPEKDRTYRICWNDVIEPILPSYGGCHKYDGVGIHCKNLLGPKVPDSNDYHVDIHMFVKTSKEDIKRLIIAQSKIDHLKTHKMYDKWLVKRVMSEIE